MGQSFEVLAVGDQRTSESGLHGTLRDISPASSLTLLCRDQSLKTSDGWPSWGKRMGMLGDLSIVPTFVVVQPTAKTRDDGECRGQAVTCLRVLMSYLTHFEWRREFRVERDLE